VLVNGRKLAHVIVFNSLEAVGDCITSFELVSVTQTAMGMPYDDVSSDEELDLRVRKVQDAVDIYSYEVDIDVDEDKKDANSLDTMLFTRDGDIHFPFTDDDPE
jgi:hypothetical protein